MVVCWVAYRVPWYYRRDGTRRCGRERWAGIAMRDLVGSEGTTAGGNMRCIAMPVCVSRAGWGGGAVLG